MPGGVVRILVRVHAWEVSHALYTFYKRSAICYMCRKFARRAPKYTNVYKTGRQWQLVGWTMGAGKMTKTLRDWGDGPRAELGMLASKT